MAGSQRASRRTKQVVALAAVGLVGCSSWSFEPAGDGETYPARDKPAEPGGWSPAGHRLALPPGLTLIGRLRCFKGGNPGDAPEEAAKHGGDVVVDRGIGSKTVYESTRHGDTLVYRPKSVRTEEFDVYRYLGPVPRTGPLVPTKPTASSAFLKQRYGEAIRLATEALRRDPANVRVREYRARSYLALAKRPGTPDRRACLERSWKDYERLLELRPEQAYRTVGLVEVAGRLERWEVLARALELQLAKPGLSRLLALDLYCWRARLREARGDRAGAIEDMGRAIQLEPTYRARLYGRRAALKARGGDLQGALADYAKGVRGLPLYRLPSSLGRAHLLHVLGNPKAALADLEAAAKYSRARRLELGLLRLELGQRNAAREAFAAELARSQAQATELLFGLGAAELLGGSPAGAEKHWARALNPRAGDDLRRAVDPLRARVLIARFLATTPSRALRNPERAMALLREVVNDSSRADAFQLASLAAVHAALGDKEQAAALQRRVTVEARQAHAQAEHRARAKRYARGETLTLSPLQVVIAPQARWPTATPLD